MINAGTAITTGLVYQMSTKKSKSFNHQVYEKSYQRLNLTATQRVVFQRLLGFLIRNDKPFPYSAVKMAELTGYDKRTIFRALDRLEQLRLINRTGLGKNRRFSRGTILVKILTTVTNRSKYNLVNNSTTATLCHQNLTNRDIVSYKKTSLYLKHKEKVIFTQEDLQQKAWYGKNPQIMVSDKDKWLFEI